MPANGDLALNGAAGPGRSIFSRIRQGGSGASAAPGRFDCGDVDQYNLVYGARRMHKRLDAMGVPHVYEEFPDNHSSVDYRMDVSLPILAKALTA